MSGVGPPTAGDLAQLRGKGNPRMGEWQDFYAPAR
jgi:hypothetical protein